MTPKKALAAYVLTVIVFLIGLLSLYHNLKPQLDEADKGIESSQVLVLERGLDQDKLSHFLLAKGYLDDTDDASLIAQTIKEHLDREGSFANLGALMKNDMKIPADTTRGGELFLERIKADRGRMGISSEYEAAAKDSTTLSMPGADGVIRVVVKNAKGVDAPLADIPVRLKQYEKRKVYRYTYETKKRRKVLTDSVYLGEKVADTIIGYARTDADGVAVFNVRKGGFYSVLPILGGYQYGREKGTTKGALEDNLSLSFVQKPHVLTILTPAQLSNIKYDRTLVVRTPTEFKNSLFSLAVAFILGWGAFLMFVFQLDRKLGTRTDYLFVIALMIITGIGLLTSFGIWNPLTDTLYGSVMTQGLVFGLMALALVTLVNYAKLDARWSSSRFWLLRNYGWVALAGAMGLLAMLYLFGSGPEGSDAKVNLFGFQPSEVSRVLIVIFMAWFFARKATLIQDFSQMLTRQMFMRQLATISWIIVGMLALMMIYMVLSDMGPALVVLVSFILIYSMARRDFAQLLLGLFSFIVVMLGARWLIPDSTEVLLTTGCLWFASWIGIWYYKKKQVYESAIFLNLVILVFSLAGPLLEQAGQTGLAARLTNRTDMAWEGVWDNEVQGGDQVVQGIWSLASGGFSGMGLGNGSPSIVPAGHTDMIFTTIGEMLGLVGLVLVVLCFFVLVHRSLLIGRRAGYTFPFYLASGLGIVTGVQFLVIVAGSLGLLPLTGITLPFLSYGRVSFIISLASFGFVVSISRLRANEIQREYTSSFNGSMVACSFLFLLVAVILLGTSAKYQILTRGDTLIRPAFVTTTEGARIVQYNPRINLVLRKIESGNIYDRNGLLLATSTVAELDSAAEFLREAGVTPEMLKVEKAKRKRRYYPYGNHMLFMIGDNNTRKVANYADNNPIGYFAENRHVHDLRGINVPTGRVSKPSKHYKENRFMAEHEDLVELTTYDYTNLLRAGFLDDGVERNAIIAEHNKHRQERDLTLTVDARLQTYLQNKMAKEIKTNGVLSKLGKLRASVVVLDAKRGDVICSANYPLPDQDSIVSMQRFATKDVPFEYVRGHAPVTERDLGLTFPTQPGSTAKVMTAMASLRKQGTKAFDQGFQIKPFMSIEKVGAEPNMFTPAKNRGGGKTTYMDDAIKWSSNCYFIMALNENDLYEELGDIYWQVGAKLNGYKSVPFLVAEETGFKTKDKFDKQVKVFQDKGLAQYKKYMDDQGQLPASTPWTDKGPDNRNRMRSIQAYTGIAWGQSELRATPFNIARVAGIVANGGKLAPTRFVLDEPVGDAITMLDGPENDKLALAMKGEASKHNFGYDLRGKTGTPMRSMPTPDGHGRSVNDAWYMFYVQSPKLDAPIAVAVRLERTPGSNSGLAVAFTKQVILDALVECGYL